MRAGAVRDAAFVAPLPRKRPRGAPGRTARGAVGNAGERKSGNATEDQEVARKRQEERARVVEQEAEMMAQEMSQAWLDEHLKTDEGRDLGASLFRTERGIERFQTATQMLPKLSKLLRETSRKDNKTRENMAADAAWLAVHIYATHIDAWLGVDAWPNAVMINASVPGLEIDAVVRAVLRDLKPYSVSAEEVREVVEAYVTATWGQPQTFERVEFLDGLVVSCPPAFASLQYSIGVLWGFALRGLVLRLALDRATGTVPETLSSARSRLERQFAAPAKPVTSSTPKSQKEELRSLLLSDTRLVAGAVGEMPLDSQRPTLMKYATEFFGHFDWMELCQPMDAAIRVLEAEIEEGSNVLAMLAASEEDSTVLLSLSGAGDGVPRSLAGGGDDEEEDESETDDDEEFRDLFVLLPQSDWAAFQRRAIVVGALLADAEAFVVAHAGPLQRGVRASTKWAQRLVRTGALSRVRVEQAGMVAKQINSPIRRLMDAIKKNIIPSKLRSARDGLDKLFGSS